MDEDEARHYDEDDSMLYCDEHEVKRCKECRDKEDPYEDYVATELRAIIRNEKEETYS